MSPEEAKQLKERVEYLEGVIAKMVKSDRLVLERLLQMADGRNVQLGTTTGTKIGTATDQKLAFYGTTPVDQPATVDDASGCNGNADEKVNLVIDRLQELGLIQ